MVEYEVEIKRIKTTLPFEAKYTVTISTYIDGRYIDRQFNLARNENKARKIALRSIMKFQKKVDAGVKFGIRFSTRGTYEEVKEALES